MNFLAVLPMAVVMIAGPQLISAIFLASGQEPRRNSLAYLAGAGLALLTGATVSYLVFRLIVHPGGDSGDNGGGHRDLGRLIDWLVLVLLLVLMVLVFRRRKRARPPRWMGRLEGASPRFALGLGLALFLAMPSDLITMVTVSASLVRHDRPWWHLLPFVLLTLLLLALPLICLLLAGQRALAVLPVMRDWANQHSWVISEIVIIFFIAMTVSDLTKS